MLADRPGLRVLGPLDFVIAKLRRGTELDLDDAQLVVQHYRLTVDAIRSAAEHALAVSPLDNTLYLFRKAVDIFCAMLSSGTPKR